ncbi:MAG: helix-turn-helix domain-containing protein [Lachnospiraceae bacterium]|nr:helix-turn-helix domain-containing protein [Lachnospiraceae bacterium]
MKIGEKIKQTRKKLELSQEALAERMGISVQAVSKWECELSCPDIMFLPQIADYLGVSLDYLLREEQEEPEALTGSIDLPEDDTVRIVQCIGNRIVRRDEWEENKDIPIIPLTFGKEAESTVDEPYELKLEIWGSAQIEGGVIGDIKAGGRVTCESVNGDVAAGSSVTCASIQGDVQAGSNVTCNGRIRGDIYAGGSVTQSEN